MNPIKKDFSDKSDNFKNYAFLQNKREKKHAFK